MDFYRLVKTLVKPKPSLNPHRRLLEEELEAVGIRLNKQKPNIYYKQKKTGGLKINAMIQLTKIDEKLVASILAEYS